MIAWREVIDNGSPLVEYQVEAGATVFLVLVVDGELVVLIYHKVRHLRQMEKPLRVLAEHKVVTIAAANADIGKGEVNLRCLRTPGFQFFRGFDATALETGTCQPRAGGTPLVVVLIKGGRKGELSVVEDIICRHVDHVHAQTVFVQMIDIP